MINYQLPNALPLTISGKGMNYLEKHPKREPTVKENFKGYLTISRGFPSLTGLPAGPLGRDRLPAFKSHPLALREARLRGLGKGYKVKMEVVS